MKSKATILSLVLFFLIPWYASAQFAGGTGSSSNPFQVATPSQLNQVRNNLSIYYIQTANIDLSEATGEATGVFWNNGAGWAPIGENYPGFIGSYNGQGYTITGLFINRPSTLVIGLFGYTSSGGTLSGIKLIDVDITGGNSTGGLAGNNRGAINISSVTGTVSGTTFNTGGLVGSNYESITGSYASGTFSGASDVLGGLVGANLGAITNSYASGVLWGNRFAGGLVGYNFGTGTITNSYAIGAVSGSSGAGGLVGINSGTVTTSYWNIESSGQTVSAGGTGLTDDYMHLQGSFSGFDFNTIWAIDNSVTVSYPYLQANEQSPHPGIQAAFTVGTGTQVDPYQVSDAIELSRVGNFPSANFIQAADIDLSEATGEATGVFWNNGAGWSSIGGYQFPGFTGNYNGQGHTITGLFMNQPSNEASRIGLFGLVNSGASLSNIGLIDVDITGKNGTGGLVGSNVGSITHSFVTGTISGDYNSGGLTAGNDGTIADSYSTATVSSVFSTTGGLVAGNYGSIIGSYATGNVTNSTINSGGLVGLNNGTIKESHATGNVSGSDRTGGLVGVNNDTITNSYATGDVSGGSAIGGLAGMNLHVATISRSYATGAVSGSTDTGGLAGFNIGTTISSYWNTETSGQLSSSGGTGLTTAQMQQQASFFGWDFNTVWAIDESSGYPFLQDDNTNELLIYGDEGWRILSSPIASATYSSILDTLWTQGITGADVTGGSPNVLVWDESAQSFTAPSNLSEAPGSGTGFITFVYDDHNKDGIADGFPKIITPSGTQFAGAVSPSITFTSTAQLANDGWNLLGNPYGATINWDAAFGWTKTNIDATFYVYSDSANGGSGSYLSWNSLSAGTLDSSLIAPWQGFWVKANATNPEITFTNDIRNTGGTFYKQNKAAPQIKLALNGPHGPSKSVVVFSELAELDKDAYDAYKLTSLTSNYLSLATIMGSLEPMDIQALPMEFEQFELDISIRGSNLSDPLDLSWEFSDLPDSWTIDLIDRQTDERFNARIINKYVFELDAKSKSSQTVSANVGENIPSSPVQLIKSKQTSDSTKNRFALILTPSKTVSNEHNYDLPQNVELQQNYPNPFNPSTTIAFGVPHTGKVTLEVFDVLGRKVATLLRGENKTTGRYTVNFDARILASGMYIYRLQAGNSVITKKLTLIK